MKNSEVNQSYRKAEVLADELRAEIVSGGIGPGERLPPRTVLRETYDVSTATIQKAFDQLRKENFIVTKDRSGTFVASRTPHQTHYALLFAFQKEHAEHNNFNRALAMAAERFNRDFVLDLHYGFEGARGVHRYQSLVEDVRKRRIAGILFASVPFALLHTPLVDEPGIPRSAFMTPHPSLADMPTVSVNGKQFLRKTVEFIKERNCRRVAVISSSESGEEEQVRIQEAFSTEGIPVVSKWFQGSDYKRPYFIRKLIQLVMSGSPAERPDCLVLLNDNLLPAASEVLKQMGIMAPEDIHLLAHCNFPWPTPSAVPAVRLGFSMTECIKAMMQQIRDQRKSQTPQKHIEIPAYFDHEFSNIKRPEIFPV